MEKKNSTTQKKASLYLMVFLVVSLVAVVLLIIYLQFGGNKSVFLTLSDYDLHANYIGNNTWEYTIQGSLPTPCHERKITISSLDNQETNLLLTITPANAETICTQVVENFEESGTFSADRSAKLTFDVDIQNNPLNNDISVNEPENPDVDYTFQNQGFTFTANYTQNNEWEYLITGQLPNPCYSSEDSPTILESFPETIIVTLTVTAGNSNCTQVITPLRISKSISGSKEANMSFDVVVNN